MTDSKTEVLRKDYANGGSSEQERVDGELHGWWRVFYPGGTVKWERQYVHGAQHGPARSFRPDGSLSEERWFRHGALHGSWRRDVGEPSEATTEFEYGFSKGSLDSARNPDFRERLLPLFRTDEAELRANLPALLRSIAKPTVYMRRGQPMRRPSNELGSFIGHVNAMADGEEWPTCDGIPLSPVLQIRASDIGIDAPPWDRWELVTVFSAPEDPGEREGDFVVRTYDSLDGLRPVPTAGAPLGPACPIVFEEAVPDLPGRNDVPPLVAALLRADPRLLEPFAPRDRLLSRVSGWPGWLQVGRVIDRPRFAFQLDSLMLEDWWCGDSTIFYFFGEAEEVFWLAEGC